MYQGDFFTPSQSFFQMDFMWSFHKVGPDCDTGLCVTKTDSCSFLFTAVVSKVAYVLESDNCVVEESWESKYEVCDISHERQTCEALR